MALIADFEKDFGSFRLQVHLQTAEKSLALFGASGSGKSLTLQCLAGLITPDRGHIALDGTVLFDSEKKICLPPQKRRVGYLFQQSNLFPNMTVEANLAAAVQDGSRQQRLAAVSHALHTFRLEHLAKHYPRQLSGGEQQRAALARILLSRPAVLLLDEPFSALDAHLKWQLEQELADTLQAYGGAVIFVTHSRDELCHLCEDVCVIEQGHTQEIRTVQALFDDPATVTAARLVGCKNLLNAEDWGIPANGTVGVWEQDWILDEAGISCEITQTIPCPDGILYAARRGQDTIYLTADTLLTVGQQVSVRPKKWMELQ